VVLGLTCAAGLLAACGTSSSSSSTPTTLKTSLTAAASSGLSTAHVFGLGTVVVDGRGYTVYVLTSSTTKNLPCTGGCASIWPPLVLPKGTAKASASGSLEMNLVGTAKVGASTVPTYDGWRLYEYAVDTGPAQSNGQGVQSYGGTWLALRPDGTTVGSVKSTATTTTSGGYGGY
jgi:predicted lipoprotein with Yx(FWY)xxD motif